MKIFLFILCSLVISGRGVLSTDNGFLEKLLPLQVIGSDPSDFADINIDETELYRRRTVTVYFSRAVVPLGIEGSYEEVSGDFVPFYFDDPLMEGSGKWIFTDTYEWTSTSRYTYPTDINCNFIWNKNLQTYDGVKLKSDNIPNSVRVRTKDLEIVEIKVFSPMSQNLTGNRWKADLGIPDDKFPELPPDASLQIFFSYIIDMDVIGSLLQVYEVGEDGTRKATDFGMSAEKCKVILDTGNYEDDFSYENCILLNFTKLDLKQDTQYLLALLEGSKYYEKAGVLRNEIAEELYGLRKFRLPFNQENFVIPSSLEEVMNTTYFGNYVSHRNLSIWLPHGLDENVPLESMKSALFLEKIPWDQGSQTQRIDYDLVMYEKGELNLLAEFELAQKYRLYTDGSSKILDGYGLPLLASSITFCTKKPEQYSVAMYRREYGSENVHSILKNNSWDGIVSLLVKNFELNEDNAYINIRSLTPDAVEDAMELARLLIEPSEFRMFQPDAQIPVPEFSPDVQILDMYYGEYLNASLGNIIIERYYGPEPKDYVMTKIRQTSWQVALSKRVLSIERDFECTFWITNAFTGEPVENVRIAIIRALTDRADGSIENTSLSTEIITDAKGMAKAELKDMESDEYDSYFVYWMRTDTESGIYEQKYFYYGIPEDFGYKTNFTYVLDRTVVAPGDKLILAGFGVSMENDEILPYGQNKRDVLIKNITIYPSLYDLYDGNDQIVTVEIDPTYGTFKTTIEIPEIVKRDEYRIRADGEEIAKFEVIDPGTRASKLTLTAPEWVKPDEKFDIGIEFENHLTGKVSNVTITASWSIGYNAMANVISLTTDEYGMAKHEVDIRKFGLSGMNRYDIYFFDVGYIGSTRQREYESVSIPVMRQNKKIAPVLSLDTDIPDVEFGVSATVTKSTKLNEMLDEEILVDLIYLANFDYRYNSVMDNLNQPEKYPDIGQIVQQCTLNSGSTRLENFKNCRITLPDVGIYALRLCTTDEVPVCDTRIKGKTLEQWLITRWDYDILINSFASSMEVTPGKSAELHVELPYTKTNLFVTWGNELKTKEKAFEFEEPGLHTFEIEIGDECVHGCRVGLVYMVPYQPDPIGASVPKRYFYDSSSPKTFTNFVALKIKDEKVPFELDIGIEPESEELVFAPGDSVDLEVFVKACPGNPNNFDSIPCEQKVPADNAEVIVCVVEKSLLEARDNPLISTSNVCNIGWDDDILDASVFPEEWLPTTSFQIALDAALEKLDIDPWLIEDLIDYSGNLVDSVDSTDDNFLKFNHKRLTVIPTNFLGYGGYVIREGPPYLTSLKSLYSGYDNRKKAYIKEYAEDEVVSFCTVVKTNAEGIANLNFIAPDIFANFLIRAYATTGLAQHGSAEREIMIRHSLELIPSAPKFARVGDVFEIKVTMAVFEGKNIDLPIEVDLMVENDDKDSIHLITADEKCKQGKGNNCFISYQRNVVFADSDGSAEILYKFRAIRVGDANITVKADMNGMSNSLTISFPVLGDQAAVNQTLSFSVEASDNSTSMESYNSIVIPESIPGSGQMELAIGINRYSTVSQTVNKILTSNWRINAENSLANVTLPLILQYYDVDRDDQLYKSSIEAFGSGVDNLSEDMLTNSICGLKYMNTDDLYCDDIILNTKAIEIGKRIIAELKSEDSQVLLDGVDKLKSLVETWEKFVKEKVLINADETTSNDQQAYSLDTLSYVRLALGPVWSVEVCPSENLCDTQDVVDTLSMERFVEANVTDMSVGEKSRAALAWLKSPSSKESAVIKIEEIIESLTEAAVIEDRIAYISETNTNARPANMESQGYALRVLLQSGEIERNEELLEKLANYIASDGASTNDRYLPIVTNSLEMVYKILALSSYDIINGDSQPSLNLQVKNGRNVILDQYISDEYKFGIKSETLSFDNFNKSSVFEITATGSGKFVLTTDFNYIPDTKSMFPIYKGIYVQSTIRRANLTDGSPMGPPLKTAPLFFRVIFSIQVTSAVDIGSIKINIGMPGGIEFAYKQYENRKETPKECYDESNHMIPALSSTCPSSMDIQFSESSFIYNDIKAGSSTMYFEAVTSAIGEWVMPPVIAADERQSDIMGASASSTFTVCKGTDCEFEYDNEETVIPKECKIDCRNVGICDISEGVCLQ